MPITNRSRAEHSRTFTGCRTCRKRHAKCDEAKPECGACRRLGLDCGGYLSQLSWITQEDAIDGTESQDLYMPGYRYPLFSDLQRRIMSEDLSESLGAQSAAEVLMHLEMASKADERQADVNLAIGPFTVFRAQKENLDVTPKQSKASSCVSCTSQDVEGPTSEASDESSHEFIEGDIGQNHPADLESFFDNISFSLNQGENMTIPDAFSSPIPNLFMDALAESMPTVDPDSIVEFESLRKDSTVPDTDANEIGDDLDSSMEISPYLNPLDASANTSLPEHANVLLRNYQQYIVSSMSSIKANRKSPWQLIFLPCVFETFAELSLLNTTSHTRSTILYALLARSAFRLHKPTILSPSTDYWANIGIRHMNKAQFHLQRAVESEMSEEQPRYKEVLMAFLAMAMVSLYRGSPTAKVFLIDAERLIRVRGLSQQRNPFKIRVLHHLYTYLRILSESIATLTQSAIGFKEQNSLHTIPAGAFRVSKETLGIGLDPTVEKTAELGYRDIHLEIQGLWKPTLHSTLQGIPESLMTLIGQTTSLANEKEHLETWAICDPKLSADLKHHIKTLEEAIWSWSLHSELTAMSSHRAQASTQTEQNLIDHPCIQSMVQAVHRALVIYFYRRIHDVSAMVLQDTVSQTLNHLEDCMDKMVEDDDFAPTLAWAAYVAAREAVTPDVQRRAFKCVSTTDSHGVYFTSKPSTEVVSSIWERRNYQRGLSCDFKPMIQSIHV
ncbi:unnamed protein product [Clonostachys rosea]|uniref:Zn(2)-C6 fungal-type domain-containing protein n=1 Tax=Bionectria ochroleuca TaxID=29856 RepID=A0ABY6UDJ9_BIOOC|nr:unnamed protein product [Clonostachys rosea]